MSPPGRSQALIPSALEAALAPCALSMSPAETA